MTLDGVTLHCGIMLRELVVGVVMTEWADMSLALVGGPDSLAHAYECDNMTHHLLPSLGMTCLSLWVTVPGIQMFLCMSSIEIVSPA